MNDFRDTRLIEAFEYIDPKYINEVGATLKLRSVYSKEEEHTKPTLRAHVKQLATLAACVLLLSLAFPFFGYVGNLIADFAAGHAGTTEELPYLVYSPDVEPLSQELMDEMNEKYIQCFLKMSKEELIAEFGENYVEELDHLRLFGKWEPCHTAYYGTFGDCIVVAQVNSPYGDSTIIIAGYEIIEHTYVYHYPTKTMYQIAVAYAMGLLDNDDIELIPERHKKCMQQGREDKTTDAAKEQPYDYILTEEDLAELNEAYFKYNFQYELKNNIYTEEQLEQIRNSKYGKFAETVEGAMQRGTYANSRFYFGKFGDSIVVAFSGMASIGQHFDLDGYRFRFRNSTVYVCHDSTLYLPTEAYELGFLNLSDVQILYDMYIEYFAGISDELKIAPQEVYQGSVLLSYEESREIVWEYIQSDGEPNNLDQIFNVKCYGKFDDVYAVMIGSNAMTFKEEKRVETVGGIDFTFETDQEMYIYYWGRFDSIDLAFDLGWIDMDDLLELEMRWNRRR
ncbi:MAG: hypothetical protein J6S71_07975 [Clostridia bacterium]|nr:hypothetical protein [Clostridia bacterium]